MASERQKLVTWGVGSLAVGIALWAYFVGPFRFEDTTAWDIAWRQVGLRVLMLGLACAPGAQLLILASQQRRQQRLLRSSVGADASAKG